jgi:hypothetical protein
MNAGNIIPNAKNRAPYIQANDALAIMDFLIQAGNDVQTAYEIAARGLQLDDGGEYWVARYYSEKKGIEIAM